MASVRLPCLLLGVALSGSAYAEEDTLPDIAFLEYLGMWDDADAESTWQLLAEEDAIAESDANDEGRDTRPQGEEPQELEDES